MRTRVGMPPALLVAAVLIGACSDGGTGPQTRDISCGTLDLSLLADGGVGRDGIPAITDPIFVSVDVASQTSYLTDASRVIGVFFDGEWLAVPHNIMYQHEIVNLNGVDQDIAVSYCPLTGSALAFDRSGVGGAEFGVSGLLYQANLILYDRNAPDESLWPQMFGQARCGPRDGQVLERHAVVETTWGGFKTLHPTGRVIGLSPADADQYNFNPYGGGYEVATNADFLGYPIPRDSRRLPKERVLGIPAAGGSAPVAFPFDAMTSQGAFYVAEFEHGGAPAAVFWDADKQAAVAVRPVIDGQPLTFSIQADGIYDNETGSRWNVAGESTFGTHQGRSLERMAEAYVAFWEPWAAFNEGTTLYLE